LATTIDVVRSSFKSLYTITAKINIQIVVDRREVSLSLMSTYCFVLGTSTALLVNEHKAQPYCPVERPMRMPHLLTSVADISDHSIRYIFARWRPC
jgi:hypothetical protein